MSSPAFRPLPLALGGMIALAVAMGVGRFIYTPILPFMLEDLGLSESEAGLIASANYVGYFLGALLGGAKLPGSRRAWLLGSLMVSGLSTAAIGVASTGLAFSILRFVGGGASAFVLLFASALVLERLRHSGESRYAALYFAGVGVGIAASAVLVSALAQADVGWRGQWLSSGAISVVLVFVVARLARPQAEPKPAAQTGAGRRGLAPLVAAYFLFGFGYVITATFLVAIVRATAEVRPLEPYIWIIVGLAAAPSVVVWNRIAARTGVIRAFSIACLVQAAGIAVSVLWPTMAGLSLAAFALGATIMGLTFLGLIGAAQMTSGDPQRVFALMTAAFGLGQIIGPTFAGVLFNQTGSFYASSLAASAALVVAALLTFTIRSRSFNRE
jgi:predicted MFS family arabinose efflux permease